MAFEAVYKYTPLTISRKYSEKFKFAFMSLIPTPGLSVRQRSAIEPAPNNQRVYDNEVCSVPRLGHCRPRNGCGLRHRRRCRRPQIRLPGVSRSGLTIRTATPNCPVKTDRCQIVTLNDFKSSDGTSPDSTSLRVHCASRWDYWGGG